MRERPPPRLRRLDRQRLIPAIPLESLIASDHQARLVRDVRSGLDLSPLYDAVGSREGGPGHPAIDPRSQAALWLYATLEGVGPARAPARLCGDHAAFRWIAGGVSVNHHTPADFRVGHVAWLDGLLSHSVAVLREQDLVALNRVAQDGMRVRASAGAASFHRKATLQGHLEEAKEQAARLKEEMDDDSSAPSRRHAAARERAARERRERLERALAGIPEMEAKKKPDEKDKVRASPTESEATVMKVADGGFRPAYNVHYAADRDALVIVGVAVIAAGSAMGRLAPMPDQIHERFDARPAEVLADGGLASLDDIEAAGAAPRDATVCAPVPTPKDPERDRHEPLPGDGPSVAAWRQRMKAEEAKGVYKQRASTAECVNTQARSRGLIRLLARGLDKVKAVAVWLAVAHNLACGSRLRAGATA